VRPDPGAERGAWVECAVETVGAEEGAGVGRGGGGRVVGSVVGVPYLFALPPRPPRTRRSRNPPPLHSYATTRPIRTHDTNPQHPPGGGGGVDPRGGGGAAQGGGSVCMGQLGGGGGGRREGGEAGDAMTGRGGCTAEGGAQRWGGGWGGWGCLEWGSAVVGSGGGAVRRAAGAGGTTSAPTSGRDHGAPQGHKGKGKKRPNNESQLY